ncbi:DUF1566 domain-containing protein [Trinickia dabaoshanensis]|uniref:DUF1566 domain-containing protein n=1 Tax=Trinickia dabaoshanensis TaxID=564714 RepID=A0A2N7VUM9_9BURK|nr:DUF1566 domain-containing protein [Trinickia dabaoshanensis]PMS20851.1 DUF1566 domain-containing protein [Trinickia dabaoshanensis]
MFDVSNGVRLADAPALGEYWQGQGGLYAGVLPDYEGHEPRVLIVGEHEAVDLVWGGAGNVEGGARDKGDGRSNTRDLVNCHQLAHAHDAARFASGYERDGHKDFYLPSRQELDVMYQTIRDTFEETAWYWSSTEQSRLLAWGRNFGGAHIESNFKDMPARALAVRTVPVIESGDAVGEG